MLAPTLQVKTKDKTVHLDLKKSKCKFCKEPVYWGRYHETTKHLPFDMQFNEDGTLKGIMLHFATCKVMHANKQSRTPQECCKKCENKRIFHYYVYRAPDKAIHILRLCLSCRDKVPVPSTAENFKRVTVCKQKTKKAPIEDWSGTPQKVDVAG